MNYRKVLPRRTFLRGAGSVAIALPFLDEMTRHSVYAATPPRTPKCITVFFAEGCGHEFSQKGLTGPLAPWKPLIEQKKKLAIYSSVRQPAKFHEAAGVAAFTASFRVGNNASKASIDQHVLKASYPNGVPTALQTLSMGMFFRRNEAWRHIRSWTAQGAPADVPVDTPSALFKRLFGSAPVASTPAVTKETVYASSVLDTVLPDYRRLTSDAGGLGAASREKLRAHLDHLELLERRAKAQPVMGCSAPAYSDPKFLGDKLAEAAPTVAPAEMQAYWRVMADLYALGLHCDLVRFGNVMFGGAAERYRFKGPWTYAGQPIAFNDSVDLHEQFHASPDGAPQMGMLYHLHFIMEQVVYFLDKLDDPAYAVGGKTFLDDNFVLVSTELGNGASHECDRVFHAVSGTGGRFKTGLVNTTDWVEAVDFYNGCLTGIGIDGRMGELSRSKATFTGLLA